MLSISSNFAQRSSRSSDKLAIVLVFTLSSVVSRSQPRNTAVDLYLWALKYSGPWSQDFGTTDSNGSAGSTYNHTTHVIRNNGSLSFTFTGTEFTAAASMTIRNVDAQNDPNWTCSVDGFSLDTGGNNGIDDTNRYILCSNDSLALGQHTVSIDVRSLGTPFWFDYMHYLPGPTVSNDSSIIIYDSLNANIQYDGTWVNSPNSGAHMTQKNGGTLSVPFNGTSISWIGFALQSLPVGATQAKYSVDLGPGVQFSIPTIPPAQDSDEFQQTYFVTPPLENGPHTLVVAYEGNGQTTPLMLDYFLVSTGPEILDNTLGSSNTSDDVGSGTTSGGILSSARPGPGPSETRSGSSSTNTPTTQNTKVVTNVGAIVGGVIGGAAFAFLAALAIFFIHKKRRREREYRSEASYYGVPQRSPDMIVSTNERVSIVPPEPWVLLGRNEQQRQQLVTSISPSTSSTGMVSVPRLDVMVIENSSPESGGYVTATGLKESPPGYSP